MPKNQRERENLNAAYSAAVFIVIFSYNYSYFRCPNRPANSESNGAATSGTLRNFLAGREG